MKPSRFIFQFLVCALALLIAWNVAPLFAGSIAGDQVGPGSAYYVNPSTMTNTIVTCNIYGDASGVVTNIVINNAGHLTNFPGFSAMGLSSASTNASTAFAPSSGSTNYAPISGSTNYVIPSGLTSSLNALSLSGDVTGYLTNTVASNASHLTNFPASLTAMAGAVTGPLGSNSMSYSNSVASGTSYTMTGTPTALSFGTASPSITLASTGTWAIWANVQTSYAGATYLSLQYTTYKLRRTNNTASDLADGSRSNAMNVITTLTTSGPQTVLGPIVYSGTSGDVITIFGNLSASPTLGSVTASSASIFAQRQQ